MSDGEQRRVQGEILPQSSKTQARIPNIPIYTCRTVVKSAWIQTQTATMSCQTRRTAKTTCRRNLRPHAIGPGGAVPPLEPQASRHRNRVRPTRARASGCSDAGTRDMADVMPVTFPSFHTALVPAAHLLAGSPYGTSANSPRVCALGGIGGRTRESY